MKAILVMLVVMVTTLSSGCNQNELEIQRAFPFTVSMRPLPFKIKKYRSVEIRLKIDRERIYTGTKFKLQYKQLVGQGMLRDENGAEILPERYFDLKHMSFALTYWSYSDTEHIMDFFVVDNFGQERKVRAKLLNDDSSEEVK